MNMPEKLGWLHTTLIAIIASLAIDTTHIHTYDSQSPSLCTQPDGIPLPFVEGPLVRDMASLSPPALCRHGHLPFVGLRQVDARD